MRICILLCYSYHGLGDCRCRACLCFCLFLVGNSLCNQTLTLIDSNSRKTATEIQERTNEKDQVGEQLFRAELDLSKGTKQAVKSGQNEHPGWDLACGGWCCTFPPLQAMHAWLCKGKKSIQMIQLSIGAFWVRSLTQLYFFLKGRTQSQNNVASSSDSYSCFQILKTDEMFSAPDWASSG